MSDNLPATPIAQNNKNAPTAFLEALEGILAKRNDYIFIGDPTEYRFAIKCYGSWAKWEELTQMPELASLIGQLRSELAQKLSSEALARILEAAKGETRDSLGANKYIYEVLSKEEKKVGRPSREAIFKEAQRLHEDDKLRAEAYQRIFEKGEL